MECQRAYICGLGFILIFHTFSIKTSVFLAPTRDNKRSPVEDTLTTEWENKTKQKPVFSFQRWDSLALTFRVARPGSPWVLGKGLLKFTSSAAGGEAAFGSLLGRRSGVTSSLRSGRLPPGHRPYIINLPASY